MNIKKFNTFKNINESNTEKLKFIKGKEINLIRRFHTTKYDQQIGDNVKIKSDSEISGNIYDIISDDPYSVSILLVKYDNGTAHIMYDKNTKEFVEGETIFHVEYLPKTEKDGRLLNLFKINFYE